MTSPSNWNRLKMKDIYSGFWDGPHATPQESKNGPVYLGIKNITEDGRLDLSEIRHIAEIDFARWTKRATPEPGDIVFTYEATLNRYAIIPEGFRGCLGRRLALIRPNPSVIDYRFLFYYFFGVEWRKTIAKHMILGSTVDRIPIINFPDFEICIPPLPTQRKIAAILSAYDDLIENNTRRIRILEEMAQAIYHEWFVKFRFPGHEGVRMVESALGLVPEGWEVSSLQDKYTKDKAVVVTGPFGSNLHAADYRKEGVPLILVKHIKRGKIIEKDLPLVGEHKWKELERYRLQQGDIVVSRVGYVGEIAYVFHQHEGWFFSGQTLRIRLPNTNILNPRYLSQSLATDETKKRIENQAVGATRASLNTDIILSFKIVLPPIALQNQFSGFIRPIDDLRLNLEHKNENLRRTRDLLLPKLVSGELDVSDMDIVQNL